MESQMIVRIDQMVKEKLTRLAKREGKNTSQVVRTLIEQYVRDQDIEGYVSELWNRIGRRLTAKGQSQTSISKVIKRVRTRKS
ncbi:MAG: hypothetical protein NPIRA04_35650 [Nitrospirales bacterium]|nr:MAG: hypothetical protein NPIRA04_35650 [Nitrospirales bacterium]